MLLKGDGESILQSSTISCHPASFTFFWPVPCHSTLEIWICPQALASFNPCLFQTALIPAVIIKPSFHLTLCFPVPWLPLKLFYAPRPGGEEMPEESQCRSENLPHCNISKASHVTLWAAADPYKLPPCINVEQRLSWLVCLCQRQS